MKIARALLFLAALIAGGPALAQPAILQAGPWTNNHTPMYAGTGSSQPVVSDSGPASGGAVGLGLSEILAVAQGAGSPPYASQGTGPSGTNICDYDAPLVNPTGYHYLCFSANAAGGGLITYGAGGSAAQLPLNFLINGTVYDLAASIAGEVTVGTTIILGGTPNGLFYDQAGKLGNLSTTPNGVLVTSPSAVPSISTTLPASLSIPSPTITGAFNAPGLVTNADLASAVTTINGTSCTLGSTCTVSTSAGSVTVGTTTITGGTSNGLLYDNSGSLGNLATANSGVLITSSGGVPSISSTLPSALSIPSPTITGAFTATGLVTNGDLVSAVTTINGTSCTLGSTCVISTSASTVTVGTTTLTSGTANGVLYNNGGVVGNTSPVNSAVLVTNSSGTPSLATTLPSALSIPGPTITSSVILPGTGYAYANGASAVTYSTTVPVSGLSGLGTGVATALGNATGGAGGLVTYSGAFGTPSALVLTNATGLPGAALLSPLASGLTIPSPTVTGAFTATGLVTNADLANASTTVNGTTCTLGSTCAPTASASTGTLTVSNGTSAPTSSQIGYVLTDSVVPTTSTGTALTSTSTPTMAETGVTVSLLAGTWNCEGSGQIFNKSDPLTSLWFAISSSTTLPSGNIALATSVANTLLISYAVPPQTFTVSSTTPVYIIAAATFNGGGNAANAGGYIQCTRTF
jgi:hypothetical protein